MKINKQIRELLLWRLARSKSAKAVFGLLTAKAKPTVSIEIDPQSSVWRFTIGDTSYGYHVALTDDLFMDDTNVKTVSLKTSLVLNKLSLTIYN